MKRECTLSVLIMILFTIMPTIIFSQIPETTRATEENYEKAIQFLKENKVEYKDCRNDYIYAAFRYSMHQSDTGITINLIENLFKQGASLNQCRLQGIESAIVKCNSKLIKLMFDNGLDYNASVALNFSAKNECFDLVKYFIQKGADPNYSLFENNGREPTPLISAIEGKNRNGGNIQIIQYLLDHKADPNLPTGSDFDTKFEIKHYPLTIAVGVKRVDIVELLLRHKAEIKNSDKILILAAISANPDTVKLFLEKNFKIENQQKQKAIEVIHFRLQQLDKCEQLYTGPKEKIYGEEYYKWPCSNLGEASIVDEYDISPVSPSYIYLKEIPHYRNQYKIILQMLEDSMRE